MRMLRIFLGALLACAALIGDAPCEVRVHLSDQLGSAITTARIRVVGAQGAAADVDPDKPFRVAGGVYTVEVRSPGFRTASFPVAIDQLEQVIPVVLQLAAVEGPSPTCSVYGHITDQAPVSHVRLMEMFGSRAIDVTLDTAREFAFRGVSCGTHLLVIVGPKSCLGTELVTAAQGTPRLDIRTPDLAGTCGARNH